MMRKILLFASAYKSSGSANGICARNLVREFIKQGHEVYVIAVPHSDEREMEELDGAKIYFEPNEWYVRVFWYLQAHHAGFLMKAVFLIFNFLRILLYGSLFPNDCRFRVSRMSKRAYGLIDECKIDTVIGTCLPYDGIAAVMKIKKRYQDRIQVVTYHFDVLSAPNNSSKLFSSFKKYRVKKAFDKELEIVDKVFLPHSAKGLYENKKIEYIGFPVFLDNDGIKETSIDLSKDKCNIVYIGSLDNRNRPPHHAILYIKELNRVNNGQFVLHIWGKLADTETVEAVKASPDCVVYHGMLDNNEIHAVMMKSDYLLNISNTLLYKLIPSKIFSMFSTGKTIINLVSHPDDSTIPYFRKYGNVKEIKLFESREDDDYHLPASKQISVNRQMFQDFTPAFIAGALLSTSK